MKNYKVTQEIIDLVEKLFDEGYEGTAEFTKSFPSGIASDLAGCMALQLSGFCKESLHLVYDEVTCNVVAFGRYSLKASWQVGEVTVEDIVGIAYEMFNSYERCGYGLPQEFKSLFLKYGFMEEKTRVVTELVRK